MPVAYSLPGRILLLLCLPLLAQSQSIPSPEIAVESTKLAAALRTISLHSKPAMEFSGIEASLKESAAVISGLTQHSRKVMDSSSGSGSVSSLLNLWKPLSNRLDSWSGDWKDHAVAIEADRVELLRIKNLWTNTLNSTEFASLPAALQSVIRADVNRILELEKAIAEQRSQVLTVQAKIAEQQILADTMIEEIRTLDNRQRIGLIGFDSAPIWQLSAVSAPVTAPPSSKSNATPAQWLKQQALFVLLALGLFAIFWCLALFALLLLRHKVSLDEPKEDETLRVLQLIMKRPFSSAVFVAVMVSAIFLRGAPSGMAHVAGFFLLIPSLRLLPGLIGSNLHYPLYGLVGLLVGLELPGLLPEGSVLSRYAWLILQCLAVAYYLWMLQLLRRRATPGPWPTFLRGLCTVALILLSVAVVANASGVVHLSHYLTMSVLYSCYGVVVVRGMVVIASSMLVWLQRSKGLDFIAESPEDRAKHELEITQVFNAIGVILLAVVFLYSADLLDAFVARADAFLGTKLTLGAIQVTLYNIAAFLLAIFASYLVSQVFRFVMESVAYRRLKFDGGQRDSFSKIIHYAVMSIGIVVAVSAAGVQLSSLAFLAGGLSVGLGLGLQSVMNNFVCGIILLFERPLQAGDLVTVGKNEGVVKGIGIRASVIRTFDGAEVIVPNGELLSGALVNWTQSDKSRRIDIPVSVSTEADPKQVMQVLSRLAEDNPLVLDTPAPAVVFSQFGNGSHEYILRFWCHFTDTVKLSSDLRTSINAAFHAADIKSPSQ